MVLPCRIPPRFKPKILKAKKTTSTGLVFQDLSSVVSMRFLNFGVDVKIIRCEADPDLVFKIYEDINSGAMQM